MNRIVALVFLCCVPIVLSVAWRPSMCPVAGRWINDLGSIMELVIQPDSPSFYAGSLQGSYKRAVGNAEDYYLLNGRYTGSGVGSLHCLVGFTIAWNNAIHGNSNSTVSFTGNYFSFDDTIYTHWALLYHTKPADMLLNTYIGKNVFKRENQTGF